MALSTLSAASEHVRGFWEYFWVYAETRVGVYRAATATAAVFALLMYFDPRFAVPAIAAYLLPPMYLYLSSDKPMTTSAPMTDTDSDSADTDADSDGVNTDAGADGADVDVDGTDVDRDIDSPDADADADGADADADVDGADADADVDG
jgi:hypothetical protein